MNWQSIMDWTRDYYENLHALRTQDFAFWAQHVLFTWRWWFKAVMLVAPWITWVFLRKKDSTHRLMYAGIFVIAASIFMDETGTMLGLWFYSAKLVPFFPGNTVYSVSAIPVATMLLIQWFPRVKPVYKALVYAAGGAFVAMPVMTWIGFYQNLHWTYWYSFPILFAMYLVASWLAHRDRFEKISGRS